MTHILYGECIGCSMPSCFGCKEDETYIRKITGMKDMTAKPAGVMHHNVGDSNYAKKKIQPWHIWEEYHLNPWDADIIKRTLRDKASQSRRLDYEKIIHVCQKRIEQIDRGWS